MVSALVVTISQPQCNHSVFYFSATNFSKIIAELEAAQTNLLTGLAGNKELLDNVQEAFAVNLENVNKEVNKLEGRLNAIELKSKK